MQANKSFCPTVLADEYIPVSIFLAFSFSINENMLMERSILIDIPLIPCEGETQSKILTPLPKKNLPRS